MRKGKAQQTTSSGTHTLGLRFPVSLFSFTMLWYFIVRSWLDRSLVMWLHRVQEALVPSLVFFIPYDVWWLSVGPHLELWGFEWVCHLGWRVSNKIWSRLNETEELFWYKQVNEYPAWCDCFVRVQQKHRKTSVMISNNMLRSIR